MLARFLVIELESNQEAVQCVQTMLENGFPRLMLLDDLSLHPSLKSKMLLCHEPSTSIQACSEPKTPSRENSVSGDRPKLKFEGKDEPNENSTDFLDILNQAAPEIVNVDVDASTMDYGNDTTENEEYQFDLADKKTHDVLSSLMGYNTKTKIKNGNSGRREVDPSKEYHRCNMCGTRVRAPRGGRWNLQMHVMALHSKARPFQCAMCTFEDYRRPGLRKHCIALHGQDLDPIDISNPEKRKEWDEAMRTCFPKFAHRTGFLEKPKGNFSATVEDSMEHENGEEVMSDDDIKLVSPTIV